MMKQSSKKTLSPVTAEEAPYTLPEGWKWVRLGDVASWSSGGTPSRKHPEYYNGSIPWVKTGELNDGFINSTEETITPEAIDHSSAKLLPVQTVLLAMYGATIGKTGILSIEAATNQACACAICNDNTYFKYLFYYLQSEKLNFIKVGKGGAQPNISQTIIKAYLFPLVSYKQQLVIVKNIENLFSKLDEAEKKIDQALAAFPARRAALLHRAFQGDLTKEWRKEHGVGMESWIQNRLGDYATVQYGYTASATEEVVGPKFLRITDIQDGIVNWNTVPYCRINDTDMEKYGLSKGDILVARTGATTGKSYLVTSEVESVFASYLIRIKMNGASLLEKYLYLFMQSPEYWRTITSFSQGIAQPGVNGSKLKELPIPVPTLPEQQEIVCFLDRLLAKEDKAKTLAASMKDRIARLRAAILARAFRGAL